jgi:hypothetical protein
MPASGLGFVGAIVRWRQPSGVDQRHRASEIGRVSDRGQREPPVNSPVSAC